MESLGVLQILQILRISNVHFGQHLSNHLYLFNIPLTRLVLLRLKRLQWVAQTLVHQPIGGPHITTTNRSD